MVVRIRLRRPRRNGSAARGGSQSLLALASLMTPVAVMAWALGVWRITAAMKWTGEFAITEGMFSHWQVWFALAIVFQFAAFLLHRYASSNDDTDNPALP